MIRAGSERDSSVLLRRPAFGDRERVAVFTEHDEFLCIAEPDKQTRFDDIAGAKEQAREAKEHRKQIGVLRSAAPAIDLEQRAAEVVELHGPMAQPEIGARASADPSITEAARAARAGTHRRRDVAERKAAELAEGAALRARLADISEERLAG